MPWTLCLCESFFFLMSVSGWWSLLVLAHRVVPDKGPLNGCVCMRVCVHVCMARAYVCMRACMREIWCMCCNAGTCCGHCSKEEGARRWRRGCTFESLQWKRAKISRWEEFEGTARRCNTVICWAVDKVHASECVFVVEYCIVNIMQLWDVLCKCDCL